MIFVLFCLYLMGDAFYRWDGFSYYATFSEFIPSFALALILWNIVAVLAATILWLFLNIVEWFGNQIKLKISIYHLLLNVFFFVILGLLFWKGKKLIWPYVQTTFHVKLIVFLFVALVSIFLTWIFRNKAGRWIVIVQERITPLAWIFSIFVLISMPIVTYHAWFKDADKAKTHKITQPFVAHKERPNIILLTFDALAAREMSLYGYPKNTTPFISKWAKNATVFTMAEAASNFTTPAAASLMTGKRVWTHQTYHIAGAKPVRSNVESLPSLLKDYGYFNMAFVVNPFASDTVLGMSNSFDIALPASEFSRSTSLFGWKFGLVDIILYRAFGNRIRLHNWILKNDFIFSRFLNLISRNISQTTVPPEKAFNSFLECINDNPPKPFFAWIYVFPPHDPYLPPESFIREGTSTSELRTYKSQEKLIEESYKYLFQYQSFPEKMQPAVDLMRDYYDEFILYSDKKVEEFISKLSAKSIKNTVIMLTADHGESFEHGYFTHGGPFLYEQVTHIPLIVKEPGHTGGRIVDDRVEQIDIPATILDLADIPVPSWMEGRSLMPLMRGRKIPQRPAFSMNFEENRSRGHQISRGSVAVWEGDYKLMHYLKRK